MQYILGRGKLRQRRVDIQAFPIMIIAVSLVAVDGQQRKQTDQLQALPQHIGKGSVIGAVIIGIKRENTSRQCIHHIPAGSLHNDVPDKRGGQIAVKTEQCAEIVQFLFVGQFIE